MTRTTTALPIVEALRATHEVPALVDGEGESLIDVEMQTQLINPDGPAAADTIAALYEALEAASTLLPKKFCDRHGISAALTLARTGSVS